MHTDDEVTARSGKASVAFSRLRARVSEQNGIGTKPKVFEAVVLPTLSFYVRLGQYTDDMKKDFLTIST